MLSLSFGRPLDQPNSVTPYGIPDLQLDNEISHFHSSGSKLDSKGRLVFFAKATIDEHAQ